MASEHTERGVWSNRVALVTGGNSGIGHAFVERLTAHGAKVIACGRNETPLQRLREGHPIIEIFRCDITIRQEVLALVAAIQDRQTGRLPRASSLAGLPPGGGFFFKPDARRAGCYPLNRGRQRLAESIG